MAEERIAALLASSFEALAREQAAAWRDCCRVLAPATVALTVDEEELHVHFTERGAQVVTGPTSQAIARVVTGRAAILDVLDDRLSLEEAVLSDRVRAVGALDDLARCHEALLAYVHAGVRTRGLPELLGRFRRDAEARRGPAHAPVR
ncbi:MAG: SCP-2 sterol transfer family protein [Alphaproteobacteria bacterium]|nr:SCP-2 sterol transfer family protein [Alphaproteobacteria bacterium]